MQSKQAENEPKPKRIIKIKKGTKANTKQN